MLLPLQGSGGWEACPVGARDQNRVNATARDTPFGTRPQRHPLDLEASALEVAWLPPVLRSRDTGLSTRFT